MGSPRPDDCVFYFFILFIDMITGSQDQYYFQESNNITLFTVYCSLAGSAVKKKVFKMPFLIMNCQIMQAHPLHFLIRLVPDSLKIFLQMC